MLEDHGYIQPALARTVELEDTGKPFDLRMDVIAVLQRTAEVTPYNTLVRLFVLARPVSEEEARAALAPVELEQLLALGLLRKSDGGIRAEAALLPFQDLLLVRDFWPQVTGKSNLGNCVLGVGPTSLALANVTVRHHVAFALDLGTGSGIQALWAARHADRVIATDTNPRALNFAAMNCRLNELSNIELRQGSLYEPVSDCRFDLIVANPPFVISPRSDYEYRDSGMSGDAISEQVIRGAPALLREGAYCTVLINWYHQSEEDWSDRLTQWVASSGCDAWILCSYHTDPISYASNWLRQTTANDPDRYTHLLDEWLAYYEQLGIGMISSGAVILRRRSCRSNWLRAERTPAGLPRGSCSDQIQRIFAAQDFLEELGDDQNLLKKTLILTRDHQLEHVLQAENGNWAVKQAQLKQTRGFQFIGNVDRLVATILAGCNGQHKVGELVDDLAVGLGMKAEQIVPACIGVIRKLLESGFLSVSAKSTTMKDTKGHEDFITLE
jgi:methylase of polypeptide subunit release factors